MGATHPIAERPRLLVVAPSAYPLGGVATWLDGLVAGLRARGWELEVALLSGRHHDVDRYLERHPLGVVRRVENRSGSREGRLRALERAIRAADAQLLLSVNVGDIEDAIARLRARGETAPTCVTTQHGLQSDFYHHLRRGARTVDGVVVTNRLSAELVCDSAGVERERVAYAPYGVDFDPEPRRPHVEPTLRIAWVGRLEARQKRVTDLVGISSELDRRGVDFRLTIAGSGPEEGSLRTALAEFLVDRRVVLAGEVAAEELRARIYARNDVLLVTSSWETGPIVAWESLSAGMAVVSSAFLGSGLEGALRHGETALLFPVGDTNSAAGELARARDSGLRERLVASGRDELRRRYTLSASIDAWERALLRLSRAGPRAALAGAVSLSPAGRLDRLLGTSLAETVRESVGVERRQAGPGDEWPHALVAGRDEREFLRRAAELDRPAERAEGAG